MTGRRMPIMKKRIVLALVLAIVALSCAQAVSLSVTWSWDYTDFDVMYYRYQLDGEYDGLWVVVDSFETMVTMDGIDGDVEHTLYLQQSYDGIAWSPSASSTIPVYVAPEPEESFEDLPIEPMGEEEEEIVFLDHEPAIEETPVIETPKEPEAVFTILDYKKLYAFAGYSNSLGLEDRRAINAGLRLAYDKLGSIAGDSTSFGFMADLSFRRMLGSSPVSLLGLGLHATASYSSRYQVWYTASLGLDSLLDLGALAYRPALAFGFAASFTDEKAPVVTLRLGYTASSLGQWVTISLGCGFKWKGSSPKQGSSLIESPVLDQGVVISAAP